MPSVQKGVPSLSPKIALKVLQINLNHCEAVQDLLTQKVREEKVNVVIIAIYLEARCDRLSSLLGMWQTFLPEAKRRPLGYLRESKDKRNVLLQLLHAAEYIARNFERVLDQLVDDAKNRWPSLVILTPGQWNGAIRRRKRGGGHSWKRSACWASRCLTTDRNQRSSGEKPVRWSTYSLSAVAWLKEITAGSCLKSTHRAIIVP